MLHIMDYFTLLDRSEYTDELMNIYTNSNIKSLLEQRHYISYVRPIKALPITLKDDKDLWQHKALLINDQIVF